MSYSTPEGNVQESIINFLEALEKSGSPLFYEIRTGQGGFGYKKGRSDLFIVYKGRHAEIEVKAPDGKRSTMQDKWKWKCESIYKVDYCCPTSFEEFMDWFNKFITQK